MTRKQGIRSARGVGDCGVCGQNPAGPHGEICEPCAVLALRAYGWAQGYADGQGGLRRGPADPQAREELDARRRAARATVVSEIVVLDDGRAVRVERDPDGTGGW